MNPRASLHYFIQFHGQLHYKSVKSNTRSSPKTQPLLSHEQTHVKTQKNTNRATIPEMQISMQTENGISYTCYKSYNYA